MDTALRSIAVQDASSAVTAFHLAVRVNPESVTADHAGIAALCQQVLQDSLREAFKEPAWQALGEEVQGTRAVLNFNTELDYCEVRGQLDAPRLAEGLSLAAKLLFGDRASTPQQVAAAKEVLSNSMADGDSNIVESTYYRFLKAFYGNQSPLARPVEGSPGSLGALSAEDLDAFRHTFLGPNNASLCLIGPAAPAELAQLARTACGEYKASLKTGVRAPVPPLPAESKVSVAVLPKWRGCSLMVGVGTPPYGTEGFLRAQLIYTLLEGEGGRLAADDDLKGNLGLNRLLNRKDEQPGVTIDLRALRRLRRRARTGRRGDPGEHPRDRAALHDDARAVAGVAGLGADPGPPRLRIRCRNRD